jgi:hypothetical protein
MDGWSAPRPGRFTPRKDPVPIVQEAGWAPGPVWTCAKNLAPTGMDPVQFPEGEGHLYFPLTNQTGSGAKADLVLFPRR